jgi:nucleoside-diphosphate kinase
MKNTHPKQERTFVILKPDTVQRNLVGDIIQRFEKVGLKMVALKMIVPTPEMVEKHYTADPEWMRKTGERTIKGYLAKGLTPPYTDPIESSKSVLVRLKKYMSSGPVIPIVLEGAHSVALVRKLVGSTEPLMSDVGTIRGDFVLDSYAMSDADGRCIRNLIHASGTTDEAEKEIALWFKADEIMKYRHIQEAIIYDVNLDGILE